MTRRRDAETRDRRARRDTVAAAIEDVARDRAVDRAAPPPDGDDLTTRLWRRAAGAAVGVLAATVLGAVVGGIGGLIAGGAAVVFAYGLGPLVLVVELRRFPATHPPTGSQLRRHWGVAAVTAITLVACGTGVANGIVGLAVTLWIVGLGGPIAAVAVTAAVTAGARLPLLGVRLLAAVVPAALLGAAAVAVAQGPEVDGYDVVDAAVVLAVVVIVPLALRLAWTGADDRAGSDDRVTARGAVALCAGAWAALAVVLPAGPVAAAATLPWLGLSASSAVAAALRWLRRPSVDHLVVTVAAGYLAVGAGWLLADRGGLEPAGFGPPFVQLTAIHFTYAGAVGTVLAWRAWRHRRGRVAALAVVATAAAPPLVAAGFVAYGPLQIVGAVLLTVGTYTYAWVVLRHVVSTGDRCGDRAVDRPAAWLLGTSAVSVVVPMLLAVQWAVGANLGTPALSIPVMAATHGTVNAVGFCLLGVLGWRRAAVRAADVDVQAEVR